MTLEEAIKHCEDVAERNEKKASWYWWTSWYWWKEGNPNYENCIECAAEHKQLAEWLKELKAVHDEIDNADDEDEIFIGYLRKKMRGE